MSIKPIQEGIILVLNAEAYLRLHTPDRDNYERIVTYIKTAGKAYRYVNDVPWLILYWPKFDWDNTKHELYPSLENTFHALAEISINDPVGRYRWIFIRNEQEITPLGNYTGEPFTADECRVMKFTNNNYRLESVQWNELVDRLLKGRDRWQQIPC